MMKWTSGFNDAPHSRGGSRISQGRQHRGGEGGARTYYFQKFFAENPLVRTDFNKFVDEYECEKKSFLKEDFLHAKTP